MKQLIMHYIGPDTKISLASIGTVMGIVIGVVLYGNMISVKADRSFDMASENKQELKDVKRDYIETMKNMNQNLSDLLVKIGKIETKLESK